MLHVTNDGHAHIRRITSAEAVPIYSLGFHGAREKPTSWKNVFEGLAAHWCITAAGRSAKQKAGRRTYRVEVAEFSCFVWMLGAHVGELTPLPIEIAEKRIDYVVGGQTIHAASASRRSTY